VVPFGICHEGFTKGRVSGLWLRRRHTHLTGEELLNTFRDFIINALKIVHRWCETKSLPVNPLKTNIMVFTRKYKPEPIQPMRPEEKENYLHLFGEIFRSLTKPLIKLEGTSHRKKKEILLLYVGV
jgi:hypothetical protein